jgi:hypothetical protein
MKLPRRRFLHLAAGAATLPAVPRIARAQAYPSRPVRIIVGLPAGTPPDLMARLIGQWVSERLGQAFIVENRPGGGGNIATEAVVKAPPDGYTLLQVNSAHAWNGALFDKLSFNFMRDIAPVASIYRQTGVMEVHPSFPAKTVAEFIAYAKANPGKINMASTGVASATHIYGELFRMLTGVNMVHVPYRGQPFALTALFAEEGHVFFDSLSTSLRAGLARRPDGGRCRAGLRGERLSRLRRTQGHARGDRRHAQSRDQRGPRRSRDQQPTDRPGRHGASAVAGRLWQAHCCGNGQVDQGGQVRGHQAGVTASGTCEDRCNFLAEAFCI